MVGLKTPNKSYGDIYGSGSRDDYDAGYSYGGVYSYGSGDGDGDGHGYGSGAGNGSGSGSGKG